MSRWTHIIVHHSATRDSGTVSWPAIRNYHVDTMGWLDIGYHAGVELAGMGFEAMIGRRWDIDGAHTKEAGMNVTSLGVCCVGNYDTAPPPDGMLETLRDRVLVHWMKLYGIPAQNIVPHRLYAMKSCPGKCFTGELLARFVPGLDLQKWRNRT